MTDSILHVPCKLDSVRLPRKNIADIQGKPSICWVIEAAMQSGEFGEILVSTPSKDIPEIKAIIQDYAPDVDVVPQYGSTVVQNTHSILSPSDYDSQITVMLATAALIMPRDIHQALHLSNTEREPVMAVIEFPHRIGEVLRETPSGRIHAPYYYSHQDSHEPRSFIDAGILYTFPSKQFRGAQSMYPPNLLPYVIPKYRGVDVDTPEDLEFVRRLAYARDVFESIP